jgi:hypothetical protein
MIKRTDPDVQVDQKMVQQWLAIRKEAGRLIYPKTAEVFWTYSKILDPYGVYSELPEECYQVGQDYFARSPESYVWVWFGDLPTATLSALCKKHEAQLAHPRRTLGDLEARLMPLTRDW